MERRRAEQSRGAPGRETATPSAALWERHATEVGELRARLASTPYTDHAEWARAARDTSAAFGAWSQRIEATPGPLADAARALSKSAQCAATRSTHRGPPARRRGARRWS